MTNKLLFIKEPLDCLSDGIAIAAIESKIKQRMTEQVK